MANQQGGVDALVREPTPPFPKQHQESPGLESGLEPIAIDRLGR